MRWHVPKEWGISSHTAENLSDAEHYETCEREGRSSSKEGWMTRCLLVLLTFLGACIQCCMCARCCECLHEVCETVKELTVLVGGMRDEVKVYRNKASLIQHEV